jgi:hypothetical protein
VWSGICKCSEVFWLHEHRQLAVGKKTPAACSRWSTKINSGVIQETAVAVLDDIWFWSCHIFRSSYLYRITRVWPMRAKIYQQTISRRIKRVNRVTYASKMRYSWWEKQLTIIHKECVVTNSNFQMGTMKKKRKLFFYFKKKFQSFKNTHRIPLFFTEEHYNRINLVEFNRSYPLHCRYKTTSWTESARELYRPSDRRCRRS